jgi:hypothetical protein
MERVVAGAADCLPDTLRQLAVIPAPINFGKIKLFVDTSGKTGA